MQLRRTWRRHTNGTLFIKLMTSFMVIVLMLVSFNFLSNAFFLNNVQSEIVNTSQANLNTTVNDYENHLKSVRKFGMSLFVNESAKLLNSSADGPVNYGLLYQLRNELQVTLAESYLMIHNIFYLLSGNSLVVEKEGTRSFDEMFVNYYGNAVYTNDYWLREFTRPYSFKPLPEAEFYMRSFGEQVSRGRFIPVLVKNQFNPQFSLIVLLDSANMFASFYQPAREGRLFIFDANGQTIFASDPASVSLPPSLLSSGQKTSYKKQGNDYYYVQKGEDTGFTYVSIIPAAHIESKIARLNWILAAFLLLSVALSLAASFFFTSRLNNPIRKILASIQQHHASMPTDSRIKEFDFISGKLKDIAEANRDIRQDLSEKNSLLKHYAYINHLKKIHTHTRDIGMRMDVEKPFVLIGFHLIVRVGNLKQIDIDAQKASYLIRELIHTHISQSFDDSLTFQVEPNLILTLLFPGENDSAVIEVQLHQLKKIIDMDQRYCLVTIAASPRQTDPAAFNETYECLVKLLKLRKLGEEVQLIPYTTSISGEATDEWERGELQTLQTHLEAGNKDELLRIGRRMLAALDKAGVPLQHAVQAVKSYVQHLLKPFSPAERERILETATAEKPEDCFTSESFNRYVEHVVTAACAANCGKKEQTDPICDYVLTFIGNRYGDDISLDIISDQLKISPSYLSTYFKDKMGINFSDYVQSYRMKKAAELLETTDLKVHEIAQRVGYHSVNSFIRNFKKFTGYPPGEYRRKRCEPSV
ncbi:helix-turn-helix transcriptional regulator [Paenibacillus sp. MBLB4367]|uniref:helix-turn-helix transcriptional regulator n=1 Tax=Paenibacillus sp. MBLB4367 TaxID=3384767 RepID=UPI0039083700